MDVLTYLSFYIEINVFCIAILLSLAIHYSLKTTEINTKASYFKATLATIIYIFMDCTVAILERDTAIRSMDSLYVFKSIYFMLEAIVGYLWFCYFEYAIGFGIEFNKVKEKVELVASFLMFIDFFLCVINSETGFIFYYTEEYEYHLGKFYLIQVAIGYIYLLAASIQAIIRSIQKKYVLEREKNLAIATVPLLPAILGFSLIRFIWLPIVSVCIVFAVFVVFLNVQEELISSDSITSLYNRKEFFRRLNNVIIERKEGASDENVDDLENSNALVLFLFSIDQLKSINEKYGVDEGNNALISVANILDSASKDAKRKGVVARIDSNKFAMYFKIVHHEIKSDAKEFEERSRIMELKNDVNSALKQNYARTERKYKLSLSIGIEKYDDSVKSYMDFIKRAEKKLEIDKKSKEMFNN